MISPVGTVDDEGLVTTVACRVSGVPVVPVVGERPKEVTVRRPMPVDVEAVALDAAIVAVPEYVTERVYTPPVLKMAEQVAEPLANVTVLEPVDPH